MGRQVRARLGSRMPPGLPGAEAPRTLPEQEGVVLTPGWGLLSASGRWALSQACPPGLRVASGGGAGV